MTPAPGRRETNCINKIEYFVQTCPNQSVSELVGLSTLAQGHNKGPGCSAPSYKPQTSKGQPLVDSSSASRGRRGTLRGWSSSLQLSHCTRGRDVRSRSLRFVPKCLFDSRSFTLLDRFTSQGDVAHVAHVCKWRIILFQRYLNKQATRLQEPKTVKTIKDLYTGRPVRFGCVNLVPAGKQKKRATRERETSSIQQLRFSSKHP